MRETEYFDYHTAAQKEHVPEIILKRIEKDVKKEFPSNQMMYELHVLRVVRSGYWKVLGSRGHPIIFDKR